MSSNGIYEKKFEEILEVEESTIGLYKYYIDEIEDSFLLDRFKEIYIDELRHVSIAKKFIRMVAE